MKLRIAYPEVTQTFSGYISLSYVFANPEFEDNQICGSKCLSSLTECNQQCFIYNRNCCDTCQEIMKECIQECLCIGECYDGCPCMDWCRNCLTTPIHTVWTIPVTMTGKISAFNTGSKIRFEL